MLNKIGHNFTCFYFVISICNIMKCPLSGIYKGLSECTNLYFIKCPRFILLMRDCTKWPRTEYPMSIKF